MMSYVRPYYTNECYIGNEFACAFAVGATSTEYATIQLFNPSGNTKIFLVNQIIGSINYAGVISIGIFFSSTQMSGTSETAVNKRTGGPASSSALVIAAPTTNPAPGAYLAAALFNGASPAPTAFVPGDDCYIVTPGNGISLAMINPASATLDGTFNWVEITP
jgi:hypothetical protein